MEAERKNEVRVEEATSSTNEETIENTTEVATNSEVEENTSAKHELQLHSK